MHLTNPTVKDALTTRLRRVEGQLRGIQRMIDEERDCKEILQQMAAARAALYSANLECARLYAKQSIHDPDARVSVDEMVDNLILSLGRTHQASC